MPSFDAGNALANILPNQIHTDVNGNQWINKGVNSRGDYILEPAASATTQGDTNVYAATGTFTDWAAGTTSAALNTAGFNVAGNDGGYYLLRTPTEDKAFRYTHPDTWTEQTAPTANGTSAFLINDQGDNYGKTVEYAVGSQRWSLPDATADITWLSRGSVFPAPTADHVHLLYDHANSDIFPNGTYAADGNNWAQKSPLTLVSGTGADTALKSISFVVDATTLANGFVTLPETPTDTSSIMLFVRGDTWNQQNVDFTFDVGTNQVRFPTLIGTMTIGDQGTVFYVGSS